jgi:DNA-binding FrmR family transcriptional regulator
MGANWFQTQSKGKNVQDAYNNAVDHANDVHGHQEGYSGEINSSAGCRDVTKEFKASKKSIAQFMDDSMDKLTKHQGAQAICIQEPVENKNKTKSQVEHIVTPGTKKWVLKYVVSGYDGEISSHDTKGAAVATARAYTEKYLSSTVIHMEKRIEKSNAIVAKVKYKPSTTEREGRWVFFGWASY